MQKRNNGQTQQMSDNLSNRGSLENITDAVVQIQGGEVALKHGTTPAGNKQMAAN